MNAFPTIIKGIRKVSYTLLAFFLLQVPYAHAATLDNPLRTDSLEGLLVIVLKAVVQIGTILLVLALVWVGFLFVMAQGSEEKIREARSAFVWTVIGGMLLLGATAISEVIKATVQTL